MSALIYHVSLSSRQRPQTCPYIFEMERKNKNIRARLLALSATKGNLINKGL
ncbi:MAG: hypothetical protein LBL39_02460 [Planctomycetaceae bacterium]|nr:hypothetical protein [Planctomycetaceae bacterium]